MKIKYPVALKLATLYPATSNRVEITFAQHNGCYERFVGNPDDGNLAFLDKLVEDANNAATVQADYDRLGAKIDDMVEERVRLRTDKRMTMLIDDQATLIGLQNTQIKQLESDAFVDRDTIKKLRAAFDEINGQYSELARKVDLTHCYTIDELNRKFFDEHMENGKLRAAVKLFKHTVGEQRHHLRRLRAKMVKRAVETGELRAGRDTLERQLKDIRRYMHEQGWQQPTERRLVNGVDPALFGADRTTLHHVALKDGKRYYREVNHKDGDPTNNTPRNLAMEVRDRYRAVKEQREVRFADLHTYGLAFDTVNADGTVTHHEIKDVLRPAVDFNAAPSSIHPVPDAFAKVSPVNLHNVEDFYRDLSRLIADSFGIKYPFPKKGE